MTHVYFKLHIVIMLI